MSENKYKMNALWERLGDLPFGVCYFCGIKSNGDALIEIRINDDGIHVPVHAHLSCAMIGEVKGLSDAGR